MPRTLSLRGHAGLCLDAPGNVGDADLVQLCAPLTTRHHSSAFALIPCRAVVGECNGHTSQLWLFDAGAYKVQYFADPSKCLDAGDMKEGTDIKLCAVHNSTTFAALAPWPHELG